jgi:hypothetical protein
MNPFNKLFYPTGRSYQIWKRKIIIVDISLSATDGKAGVIEYPPIKIPFQDYPQAFDDVNRTYCTELFDTIAVIRRWAMGRNTMEGKSWPIYREQS